MLEHDYFLIIKNDNPEERVLAQAEAGVPEFVANVGFRNTAPTVKSEFRVTKQEPKDSQELCAQDKHRPVSEINATGRQHNVVED